MIKEQGGSFFLPLYLMVTSAQLSSVLVFLKSRLGRRQKGASRFKLLKIGGHLHLLEGLFGLTWQNRGNARQLLTLARPMQLTSTWHGQVRNLGASKWTSTVELAAFRSALKLGRCWWSTLGSQESSAWKGGSQGVRHGSCEAVFGVVGRVYKVWSLAKFNLLRGWSEISNTERIWNHCRFSALFFAVHLFEGVGGLFIRHRVCSDKEKQRVSVLRVGNK